MVIDPAKIDMVPFKFDSRSCLVGGGYFVEELAKLIPQL